MKPVTRLIDLQRTLTTVGEIRVGAKVTGTTKDGREYTRPDKLTEFRFTSADKSALEQIAAMYGGEVQPWEGHPGEYELFSKASEIYVTLMPGVSVPKTEYAAWAASALLRSCDGETCKTYIDGEIIDGPCVCADRSALMALLSPAKRNDAAKLESHLEAAQCKMTTRITFQLPGTTALGGWKLSTNSYYAAAELVPTIETLMSLSNGQPVTVKLAIEPRTSNTNGKKDFVVLVARLADDPHAEVAALGGASLQALVSKAIQPQSSRPAAIESSAVSLPESVEEHPDVPLADPDTGEVVEVVAAPQADSVGLWWAAFTPEQQRELVEILREQKVTMNELGEKCIKNNWSGFGMVKAAISGWNK